MKDFQMERVDLTCPKCGRRDYMYRLFGKNVGKLNIKCTNCNSYYDSTADYSYLLGIRQKEEPMGDLISRQAAITLPIMPKEYRKHEIDCDDAYEQGWCDCQSCIGRLPTAEKKGKWVLTDYPDEQTYRCSACNEIWTFIVGTPEDNGAFFCPNCGADMREEQNDSV